VHEQIAKVKSMFRDPEIRMQPTIQEIGLVEHSEDALAVDLANRHHCDLRYTAGMDWMHFNGNGWEPDKRLRRFDYARQLCRTVAAGLEDKAARRIATASTVNAVVSLARCDQRLVVDADEWDTDERVLNTPGGLVDLLTGEIRPTLHTDLVTRITEVPPMDKPLDKWERFLKSVFAGDSEVIDFIQVLLGYCLTGSTREQKLFFFFGKGSNGKSTLLDLVEWILGDYSLKLPASVLMQSKHSSHPTELAQLQGRRLATSSEIEDGQYWAESRIKELTGDEMLSARFMRQDFFQFSQTQKHIICGNYRPRLKGGDSAIQRRMILVPFGASFEGKKQDKELLDKLKDDAPAILHWMIQGAVRWAAEGLVIPDKIRAASAEYMTTMDDLGEWVEDCCDLDPAERESNKYLFASFAEWKQQRAEKVPSIATWGERMRQQLRLEGYRTKRERGFRGISLRPEEIKRLTTMGKI
jgi:putative DNA primase/helicase